MTREPTPFQIALEKRRARKAAEEAAAKKVPIGLEDVIGREDASSYDPDPLIQFVKDLPANIAIELLTDKMPKPANFAQKDGIKFRCPHSDHADRDPSAWISPGKGLWTCGACETGGDWIELAAATLGFRDSRGWRDRKADWIKFRDQLADRVGWKDPVPEPYEVKSEPSEGASGRSEALSTGPLMPVSTVRGLLDWRNLFAEDTFLHQYMTAVTADDVPEEFHFASALLGLGMALGRTVTLQDNPPVHGNLYVCVIGQSGSGKTKAGWYLRQVLAMALPFDRLDPMNRGAKMIPNTGSGEVLYEHFSKPVKDPANDRIIAFYAEVRGIVLFNELSGLTSRANRVGATIKQALIDLYDCPTDFSTSNRTHGETIAKDPFGSMMTSTQPGSIQDLVSGKDDRSGFLNRFIFLTGTLKPTFALNTVEIDLDSSATKLRLVERWGDATFSGGGRIQWTPEGAQEWSNFYHSVVEPDKRNSTNDMLGRIDLLMKKLILLFTANRMEETVSADTVREACSLYQYFVESYNFTSDQIDLRSVTETEDKVLVTLRGMLERKAKEKGVAKLEVDDWPTGRELQQHVRPKMTSQELTRLLTAMVENGILEAVQPPKRAKAGPPPAKRYVPVQYAE